MSVNSEYHSNALTVKYPNILILRSFGLFFNAIKTEPSAANVKLCFLMAFPFSAFLSIQFIDRWPIHDIRMTFMYVRVLSAD